MPDQKISQLTAATTPLTGTELVPLVQSGGNVKATTQDIANLAGGGGGSLTGQTDSATPFETSLGYQAGNDNIGINNTFIGYQSGLVNSTGLNNTALGYNALISNTTGIRNTAIGSNASAANTTASRNIAIGWNAHRYNETGVNNVIIGSNSGATATNSSDNTLIGDNAGRFMTTGEYNILIGAGAGTAIVSGQDLETGSNNIIIGRNATTTDGSASGRIIIGNGSNNELYLPGLQNGKSAGYVLTFDGTKITLQPPTALSDARDKTDIVPLMAGVDFINALNPVAFTWNMRDGSKVGQADTGFIAQELKAAQEETGINIPGLVYEANPERLEVAYGKLIPVLAKAIQELSAKVVELEAKVN